MIGMVLGLALAQAADDGGQEAHVGGALGVERHPEWARHPDAPWTVFR